MKISILVSACAWGGVEAHTLGLADALEQRDHQVEILSIGQQSYEFYRKALGSTKRLFRLQHIPVATAPREVSLTTWLRLLRPFRGEACVVEKNGLDFGNFSLDIAAKLLFSRLITIEQLEAPPLPPKASRRHFAGMVPGVGLWWYQWQLSGFVRSLAPRNVICVSDAVKARLKKDYSFPCRKLITVHNGADPERFKPDPVARRAMRQRWGVPESAFVFGAVGRLATFKGFDIAVELFARLAASNRRECYLVLVGEGPERATLEQLVVAKGLSGRVRFPGFSDRPWEAFCGLDVFVMPSRVEGLPLALVEAMACGCCPIAMGVSGIPEVIRDPSLGWCVTPGDSEAFLRAMECAETATHEDLSYMACRTRDHVLQNFRRFHPYLPGLQILWKSARCDRNFFADWKVEFRVLIANKLVVWRVTTRRMASDIAGIFSRT